MFQGVLLLLNVGTIDFSSCRSDLLLLSAVHCGAVCLLWPLPKMMIMIYFLKSSVILIWWVVFWVLESFPLAFSANSYFWAWARSETRLQFWRSKDFALIGGIDCRLCWIQTSCKWWISWTKKIECDLELCLTNFFLQSLSELCAISPCYSCLLVSWRTSFLMDSCLISC